MGKSAVITARLDEETLKLVDRVAKAHGRSRAAFAAQAIRQIAEREAEFLAFIHEGVDAADRGDVLSQDEMEQWYDAKIADRKAAG